MLMEESQGVHSIGVGGGGAYLAAGGSGRACAQARKAHVIAMPVASGNTCTCATSTIPAACSASSARKWHTLASSDEPAACTPPTAIIVV